MYTLFLFHATVQRFSLISISLAVIGVTAFAAYATHDAQAVVRRGESDERVRVVQQALNVTACVVATEGPGSLGEETTYFGGKTEVALRCYQALEGMSVTGILDAVTLLSLQKRHTVHQLNRLATAQGTDVRTFLHRRGLALIDFGLHERDLQVSQVAAATERIPCECGASVDSCGYGCSVVPGTEGPSCENYEGRRVTQTWACAGPNRATVYGCNRSITCPPSYQAPPSSPSPEPPATPCECGEQKDTCGYGCTSNSLKKVRERYCPGGFIGYDRDYTWFCDGTNRGRASCDAQERTCRAQREACTCGASKDSCGYGCSAQNSRTQNESCQYGQRGGRKTHTWTCTGQGRNNSPPCEEVEGRACYTNTPGSGDTPSAAISVQSVAFYGDKRLSQRLTPGTYQQPGTTIYTHVTFSGEVEHRRGTAASVSPQIYYRVGSANAQYGIVDYQDALQHSSCQPDHRTRRNAYICRYNVPSSVSNTFTAVVTLPNGDSYRHGDHLLLDGVAPVLTRVTGVSSDSSSVTVTVDATYQNQQIAETVALAFSGACERFGEGRNGRSASITVPVGLQRRYQHTITLEAPSGTYRNCGVALIDGAGNRSNVINLSEDISVQRTSRRSGGGGGGGGSLRGSSGTYTPVPVVSNNGGILYTQGQQHATIGTVQRALNSVGCLVSATGSGSPGSETAYYGAKTAAAVACYQRLQGLPATGTLDLRTYLTLNIDYIKRRIVLVLRVRGIDPVSFLRNNGLDPVSFGL